MIQRGLQRLKNLGRGKRTKELYGMADSKGGVVELVV